MQDIIEKMEKMKSDYTINYKEIVEDIIYYGKINLSKNDPDLRNERQEDVYLLEKNSDGTHILEFRTDSGVLATVDEEGNIRITDEYRPFINETEFLLQLGKASSKSLEELKKLQKEEIEQDKSVGATSSRPIKQDKSVGARRRRPEELEKDSKYDPNSKDVIIDMDKKVIENSTFADLVPEVKQKGIVDVRVRRLDSQRFEFYGINASGEEVAIESLQKTEGTDPTQEITMVNGDGSKVTIGEADTMLKIVKGENQGRENEGFAIKLGNYGIPEISYYRRASETGDYLSTPVSAKNTNQKWTDLDVRQMMEKTRNTSVEEEIRRTDEQIEMNDDKETTLEDIDDNPYNDKSDLDYEIMIEKAASRCKVSVKSFKEELEKSEGDSLEEKIQNAEEEINEQAIGGERRR